MTKLPMLADILGQPASHLAVLQAQEGAEATTQQAAADLLRRCRGQVLVSGMGASYFALLPFVQMLQLAGRHAVAVESSDLLHAQGLRWRAGDCAVLISRSGGSVEVLRLAERLRADGVAVVGVTNVPGSALAGAADVTLIVGSLPDELIAVQSYTGTVLALLLLGAAVVGDGAAELAETMNGALPQLKECIGGALSESDQWQPLLERAWPLYLLGRGAATATVYEGSLLLHETAKAPAVAMASGQFRHGPVEVVDGSFRAVVVGTASPTRYLDWKLALDLERMGGQVLWVGPRISDEPLVSMVRWPENVPEPLLPLFDVVPLQVAALRTAEWRRIVAGAFRFASEVTADEESFPFFEEQNRDGRHA